MHDLNRTVSRELLIDDQLPILQFRKSAKASQAASNNSAKSLQPPKPKSQAQSHKSSSKYVIIYHLISFHS